MFDVWKQKLKNNNFLVKKEKQKKYCSAESKEQVWILKKKSQNEKSASSNPI